MSLAPISSRITPLTQPLVSPNRGKALAENQFIQRVWEQHLSVELKKDERTGDITPTAKTPSNITVPPISKEEWDELHIDVSNNPKFNDSILDLKKRLSKFFTTNSLLKADVQAQHFTIDAKKTCKAQGQAQDFVIETERPCVAVFNGIKLGIGFATVREHGGGYVQSAERACIMAMARIEQAMKTYGTFDITQETLLTKEEWDRLQIDLSKKPEFDDDIPDQWSRLLKFLETNSSAAVELQKSTKFPGGEQRCFVAFNGVNLGIGATSDIVFKAGNARALQRACAMAIARIEQAMETYGKTDEKQNASENHNVEKKTDEVNITSSVYYIV